MFDVPNSAFTIGEGLNTAGTIVGYYDDLTGVDHGFVLNNGVFMTVDVPGAQQTQIQSINAKGEIVGAYFDSNDVGHGFLGVPPR
jgi:uncharacterized membrane protein